MAELTFCIRVVLAASDEINADAICCAVVFVLTFAVLKALTALSSGLGVAVAE
jgi:hypothetical protein